MSIIDDIREAERKADRIRKEAKEKGKEIVKEAKTVAENNKKKRLTDYQNACDKKLKEAEEKQEVYLKTRLKAAAENDEKFISNNEKHLPNAVQYILEKVKSI